MFVLNLTKAKIRMLKKRTFRLKCMTERSRLLVGLIVKIDHDFMLLSVLEEWNDSRHICTKKK